MTETKRCCGYKGHWECAGDYPDHMVPEENFGLNRTAKDGKQGMCRKCTNYRTTIWHHDQMPRHPKTGTRKDAWIRTVAFKNGGIKGSSEWKSYLDSARKQWDKEVAEWKINDKVVDITPRFKSEFGPSKPMTKRESKVVEGEKIPEGWVYVVRNPDIPSVIKIGKTFPDGIPDIMSSARRFGRSELMDKFWFEEAYKAEQSIHTLLNSCNLRTLGYKDCGKELFKCTIEEAMDAITKVQSGNDRPSIAVGE